MEVVDSQRIRADKNGDRLPVKTKFIPDTAGEKKVSLKVAPQTGELVTTNNEVSTFVTVLDGGLKVLYLNGALQPDVKFLRRSLDASPDMNVELRTIDARKPETRPKDLDELFRAGSVRRLYPGRSGRERLHGAGVGLPWPRLSSAAPV